ncbi:MAG: hypothetical protein DMG40_15715 [Acidobacteria bacterium]|nr:MAG: hypothetical protein DMG40_15715 [Acidobacteriota bacterium]
MSTASFLVAHHVEAGGETGDVFQSGSDRRGKVRDSVGGLLGLGHELKGERREPVGAMSNGRVDFALLRPEPARAAFTLPALRVAGTRHIVPSCSGRLTLAVLPSVLGTPVPG